MADVDPVASVCAAYTEIPRVSFVDLSTPEFIERYFLQAKPVVITGATETWPARDWTIANLMERVGQNEVWIRGKTNQDRYRQGKAYTIRKDTFDNYCQDLLRSNARARSSYLAVASMQMAFPQLLDEVPFPQYMTETSTKLHLGPYMWVALKGHYEFCHFDPDDNFLVMIQGRKKIRLFGYDIDSLYPNPLGSHGKTVQSQVICDEPDLVSFPKFAHAKCEHCILYPGEMLFIPAFYWHQVSALDSGISLNMFYGDGGESQYVRKILRPPYRAHFEYWLLNVVEQNRSQPSFERILSRLPEVLAHFFMKQWHDTAESDLIQTCVEIIRQHCHIQELPPKNDQSKFPPMLKIRGLLHRDGTKT
ncbi:hypothetical protein TCAL_11500 [Tigriopus californicus]|uniref:JmjC domain-containing protein n=1 Tax=Tigriopus californicus TaxID=6832 RepID=A0A553NFI2_TIGCA|nr:bifunctional peptidase and arginyl-hydroxylase JMJD5-like [Tigriopus californicus]TRY64207.1 hypothetical protein TCAL_11500 [Tigriopus californicus]|eukprot:TCALIF_11500-PA protein Name:"Similar to KDM8 Lysine-specific demethylase 8 (Homo sapiens)" AED:0.09 eAED:0.09 QI:0/-1/0/1/-1/1/1/0/362